MFSSTKRSALISWLLHCGAILLIVAVTSVKPKLITHIHEALVYISDPAPSRTVVTHTGGGGGGGMHASTPASLGNPAPFAHRQFVPPVVEIVNQSPILPMEPTLVGNPDIKLATLNLSVYGDPHGVRGAPSAGPGNGTGIGSGDGTGIGPGKGPGFGPGEDGGTGGVGYLGSAGGAITQPQVLYKAEPQYSEEARRARLQGAVVLRIEIGTDGRATNVGVRQSLGLGLDDRAMDAVKLWKFLPGKVNGKPVPMVAYVEVNFRLL